MTNTSTPATEQTSPTPSQQFLEAVLYKDSKALREFGVDDKAVQDITLDTQIAVAHKLLASDNNSRRSQSKRVIAARELAGKEIPAKEIDQKPVQATVTKLPTFNPNPSGQKFG